MAITHPDHEAAVRTQLESWTSDEKVWRRGLFDIREGFLSWRIWTALAREDFRQRFRQTVFGLLWILMTFAAFIIVKAVIFGQLNSGYEFSFAVFLCSGYLAWQFIQNSVIEGARAFTGASNWIRGMRLPLSVFVFQSLTRNLIIFFYSSIALIGILLFERTQLSTTALMFFPALLIFCVNLVWVELLLGSISTRYRDVEHLCGLVMRIMFFLTPILWVPSSLGKLGKYVWWNPFTHYLEIMRAPILTGDPAILSWIVVLSITVVGWIAALIVFSINKHRIIVWL